MPFYFYIFFCLLAYRTHQAVQPFGSTAIIKKRLGLDQSLYNILQILSLTLFEKTMLFQLLDVSGYHKLEEGSHIQLKLFDS
jgi:hypothetical protein